ncbi:helix-turn-helix transcriptional regulator [Streptomyces sp. DSM 40750]|uniref:helix-turn-helix transcriptional regulator n=1 Tax=Streptomyces sp. DSM 40750 TaxID=2801030 RepID=UPI00214C44B8|nr:helix-turn-helix transcriptional regulator [Streptomyces sp. DSM 40750]UUU19246.1 helix-turn-helix transcriptional regulator [Streptomyces sp. DSM 40750]UUU27410.1 helix-turn-helix transcriptional regulator [Streptomyces sp. DSM 40750]
MPSHITPSSAQPPTRTPEGEDSDLGLDRRAELREFLRSRRARLRPEDVGLPSSGRRRVPGLRREELARLAGVSFAYYTRLEQGHGDTMSAEVLDAVARALRLNGDEHAHLFRLARPDLHGKRHAVPQRLRPGIQQLLDALDGVPAYVCGRGLDILGWNRLATTVFGDWSRLPPRERNLSRLVFLSPAARDRFADLEAKMLDLVSILRVDAGTHPEDRELAALIGELMEKSNDFRRLWARHDVRRRGHGVQRLRHPVVGELTLSFEAMGLPGDTDQTLVVHHAEPGSTCRKALWLLTGLAAPRTESAS